MVKRRTVAFDDFLYERIQSIRSVLLDKHIIEDVSFTTTVNFLIVAALIGARDFKEDTWKSIIEFLVEEGVKLNKAKIEGVKKTFEIGLNFGVLTIKHKREAQ